MIAVKKVETKEELQAVHHIRREVFVVEQHCPEDIEWEYEEESFHYLATVNGTPAGTARWRETQKGIKLERFAVLMPYRSSGVGRALLQYLLQQLPDNAPSIYLHAQLTAKPFYLKNGFAPVGEHFWEADIEHVKMVYGQSNQK